MTFTFRAWDPDAETRQEYKTAARKAFAAWLDGQLEEKYGEQRTAAPYANPTPEIAARNARIARVYLETGDFQATYEYVRRGEGEWLSEQTVRTIIRTQLPETAKKAPAPNPERNRAMYQLYCEDDRPTFAEIAERFGVSQARALQIIRREERRDQGQ
jgi:hypothetical protein